MIKHKDTQHRKKIYPCPNAMTVLSLLVLLSFPALVYARADIDEPGMVTNSEIHGVLTAIGVCGAIACHFHRDLVTQYSEIVDGILRWAFRIAVLLLILPIISNYTDFYFDKYPGTTLIGVWGILKAAQGIYISGVATGIGRRKND